MNADSATPLHVHWRLDTSFVNCCCDACARTTSVDSCLYTHALTLSVSLLDILAELWLLVGLNNLLSDCQAKHKRFSSVLTCSATTALAQTQTAHTDSENEQKARGWANRQNVIDNSTDWQTHTHTKYTMYWYVHKLENVKITLN